MFDEGALSGTTKGKAVGAELGEQGSSLLVLDIGQVGLSIKFKG